MNFSPVGQAFVDPTVVVLIGWDIYNVAVRRGPTGEIVSVVIQDVVGRLRPVNWPSAPLDFGHGATIMLSRVLSALRTTMGRALAASLAGWAGAVPAQEPAPARPMVVPKDARASVRSLEDKEKRLELTHMGYVVLEEKAGWLKVQAPDGTRGWLLSKEAVALEKAEAYFSSKTKEWPQDARAFLSRGHARALNGRHEAALEDYAESLRLDPKLDFAYQCRAFVRINMGRPDEAIKEFDEALRAAPRSVGALMGRAEAHCLKADYAAAVADYDAAIRLDPKDSRLFCNKGWAQLGLGKGEQSLQSLNKAIELNGKYGMAFGIRALVHTVAGDLKNASKDYARSVELEPEDAKLLAGCAWFLATCPDAKYRDGKRALELAGKAVRKAKDRDTVESLAAACAEVGDFEKAVRHQEEAVALPKMHAELEDNGRIRLDLYKKKQPYRFEPNID